MSEMIERVARGMCRAAITKPLAFMYSPDGVEYHVNKRWPEYVDHARAAIEAMRVPTSDMITAADKKVRADSDNLQCPDWYTAAIDAALSPSAEKET